MKKVKNLFALLVVLTFMTSCIAGCGGSTKKVEDDADADSAVSTAQKATSGDSSVPEEKMEISIALWNITGSLPEGKEDKVYETLKNKLNITIKPVNLTWDDYDQKVQMWAASQQLPDVFAAAARKFQSYTKWVEQGVIRAVPDDVSKYPNLKALLDQPSVMAYKDPSGKYYCIPRPAYKSTANYSIEAGIKIRKDWMENVGITKDPENTDEFIALMKAFIEKDPDRNGQNDTIGLTAWNSYWALTNLITSIYPEINAGWVKEDGKWVPGWLTKNAVNGVKELKKIYDSGALDRDTAILKGTEGEDKFFTGKAGALAHNAYLTNTEVEKWAKTYPDKKYGDCVKILNPWKAQDGNYYRLEADSVWSESYFPANVKDDKMDRILMLFDYMLSPEGMDLYHYGIEGIDYKKNGDKIEVTRAKDSNGAFVKTASIYPSCNEFWTLVTWDTEFGFMEDPTIEPSTIKVIQDYHKFCMEKCTAVPTNYALSFLDIPSKDKMTASTADDIMKAIMSKDAEKTWNELMDEHMKNGYDKIIKEMNDAAAKAGIQ